MVKEWVILSVFLYGPAVLGQAVREVPSDNPGIRITVETVTSSDAAPGARIEAAVRNWEGQLGAVAPGARPIEKTGAAGTVAAVVERFHGDPDNLHGFLAKGRGQSVCHVQASAKVPGVATALSAALRRCSDEMAQETPQTPETTPDTKPDATPKTRPETKEGSDAAGASSPQEGPLASVGGAPPAHPENWDRVAGVYFQSGAGFGAGGMAVVTFAPVVLFRDGTYYEIGSAALEDTDLSAAKAKRPRAFGQWSRTGDVFRLMSEKGRPREMKLQDGQFFRAFSAEEGGRLAGKYEKVSGGGNSAMGGQVTVLTQHDMTFTQDGHFRTQSSMGAIDTGGQTGVGVTAGSKKRTPGTGAYAMQHHTITLRYPDGHMERHFFAYASKKAPAQISRDMIFIDDDPLISEDVD